MLDTLNLMLFGIFCVCLPTKSVGKWFGRLQKLLAAAAKSRQSCPTLCDPTDSSPPGSAIHRILQAWTLGWVAISFSIKEEEGKEKENGNPLQYSCLENPMDRGAWWATVHGVTKSQTGLSNFTVHQKLHTDCYFCLVSKSCLILLQLHGQ